VGLQRPSVCRNGADITGVQEKKEILFVFGSESSNSIRSLLLPKGVLSLETCSAPEHNTTDIAQGKENFIQIHSMPQKYLNQKQM
jgi:hypothetical protein